MENQLSGTVANIFDQTLAFKLPMAFAARNAIVSAEMAQLGFTGPADAIGGAHGFFDMFCASPEPEKITRRLGEAFYADCVIKPWSSCRASHPSLDACVRIATENVLDEDEIQEIVIHVTPRTLAGFVGPAVRDRGMPGGVRCLQHPLHRRDGADVQDGPARTPHARAHAGSAAAAPAGKITLVDSLAPTEYLTAEVQVRLRNGSVLQTRTDVPKGDIYASPMSEAEILEKYYANVEFGGRTPAPECRASRRACPAP